MSHFTTRKNKAQQFRDEVVETIVALLEQGTNPFEQRWNIAGYNGLPLRVGGQPYQGFNSFWLSITAMTQGFTAGHWMTFNQAKKLGGTVRKGEKSTLVVKYGTYIPNKDKLAVKKGVVSEDCVRCKYLKVYPVFNASQIDHLPQEYYYRERKDLHQNADERYSYLEEFFAGQGASVSERGNVAAFLPVQDIIEIPEFSRFKSAEHYYSTLAHEFTHWTGSEKRLGRIDLSNFGPEEQAREELVAELGAAFLSTHFGFRHTMMEEHASYIDGWLSVLQKDQNALFKAAAEAWQAFEYLVNPG